MGSVLADRAGYYRVSQKNIPSLVSLTEEGTFLLGHPVHLLGLEDWRRTRSSSWTTLLLAPQGGEQEEEPRASVLTQGAAGPGLARAPCLGAEGGLEEGRKVMQVQGATFGRCSS